MYYLYLIGALARHEAQYNDFRKRHAHHWEGQMEASDEAEELRIPIILVTACLVEALANVYLALKLKKGFDKKLEYETPTVKKWCSIPAKFLPGYTLPADIQADIESLFQRRNGLAHLKEEIEVDGTIIHKGNLPDSSASEDATLARWISLPLELIFNLQKFDRSPEGSMMPHSVEMHLGIARANELRRRAPKLPPKVRRQRG